MTSDLRSGSRWLMLSTVAAGALNYGYTLILLHLLQAADYAVFAAGQALVLTVGSVAQCAVPWVLAHELTVARDDPDGRRAAVSFAILANTVAGLIGAVLAGVVAAGFASGTGCVVVAASVAAVFVSNTTRGWLQGEQRFGLLAAVVVAEVVGKIVAGLALIAAGLGSTGALAGFAAGALLIVVLGAVWMRRDLRPAFGTDHLRRSLRTTAAMTVMQGLFAVQANLDVLLVAMLPVPVDAAAGYQAGAVLGRVPVFLATGLSVVMFPLVAAARNRAAVLATAMSWYASIAACVAAVLATAPAGLVRLVIPGRFTGSTTLLPLLTVVGVGAGVVGLITAYLQAVQRYRAAVRVQVAGLLTTAVAIAAGWRLAGPTGVAVGAAAGAAGTAIALQVLVQGSWRRWNPLPGRSVALLAALVTVLLPLRGHPAAWLTVATATGVGCAYLLLRVRRPAANAGEAADPPAPSPTEKPDTAVVAEAAHKGHFPGPILVVSPHLDDGVLSCGALLAALAPEHRVTVATLFTEAPPGPISLSARRYLFGCGARSAEALYRLRREEDQEVLAALGADAVHLGMVEALFRRPEQTTPGRTLTARTSEARKLGARALAARWLPEVALTYPTYRYHVTAGVPAPRDEPVVRRVADEISALVASLRPATVLVPLGVGGHVDHVIARSIGERLPHLVVYYADFPYVTRSPADDTFTRDHDLMPIEWHEGVAAKERLIRGYRSQLPSLFPGGRIPPLPERYFVPAQRRAGAVAGEPVS